MTLDPERLQRQKGLARTWWDRGGVGSFLAATGFGKTLVALIALKALQRRAPELQTVVAVPSDYLRQQWRAKLRAFSLEGVHVNTVHTLLSRPRRADLLILDEMHSYTSPVFSGIFRAIGYRYLLGMTATLREDPERNALLHAKCPVFDEVSLSECLDKGWVAPFVLYNYGLELSEDEMRAYRIMSGKFNKAFGVFGHDMTLAFQCLKDKAACEAYARQIRWKPEAVRIQASNMVRNMSKRKQFLYNYPGLITEGKRIIETLGEGRKIITFSQSNAAVDRMTEALGPERAMSYHTGLKQARIGGQLYRGKKLKTKIIELFKAGEISVLNTAKALDQGVDIEDIDMSLVCSGTSSALQAIQRTGRHIRAKTGKRACEINLFVRDTQSEKWLRKRQRKHPKATINYISDLNEIAL